METNQLPELTKKNFNIWKLLDFSLTELTINPEYDLIHHGIYTEMLRINNVNEWKDVIGIPTKHTAERVCGISIKTYRKKLKELQGFGMIRIIKKSSNQWQSTIITLKTEYFKAFTISKHLISNSKKNIRLNGNEQDSKMPGNLEAIANGYSMRRAGEPKGHSIYPHIKQNGGQAPIFENEEAKRESELANAVPPAKEKEPTNLPSQEGRYSRYGLPDTLKEELFTYLQEKDVMRHHVHQVLSSSHNTDVLKAVMSQHSITREEAVKTIQIVIQFLQEHPSPKGDETITALTLTPDEKHALKDRTSIQKP